MKHLEHGSMPKCLQCLQCSVSAFRGGPSGHGIATSLNNMVYYKISGQSAAVISFIVSCLLYWLRKKRLEHDIHLINYIYIHLYDYNDFVIDFCRDSLGFRANPWPWRGPCWWTNTMRRCCRQSRPWRDPKQRWWVMMRYNNVETNILLEDFWTIYIYMKLLYMNLLY